MVFTFQKSCHLLKLSKMLMGNILKDFENASPKLNPLFHKPSECLRDNYYCISLSDYLVVCPRNIMVVNLL